jgi:hypothetical protein
MPNPSTPIVSFRPVDEAAAAEYVASMAELASHPEVLALRSAQESAGTAGTPAGLADMANLYRSLQTGQTA